MNVLYLGMADDIITPLLLFPNLDTLFVIDKFDSSYNVSKGQSIEGNFDLNKLKKIIMTELKTGQTLDSRVHSSVSFGDEAQIISSSTELYDESEKWTLIFQFKGIVRKLIRYERNFHKTWPDDITNINHIITIGSAEFDDLNCIYDHFNEERQTIPENAELDPKRNGIFGGHNHYSGIYRLLNKDKTLTFRKMVVDRTVLPFTWTALSFSHTKFPTHFYLENGRGNYSKTITYTEKDDESLKECDKVIISDVAKLASVQINSTKEDDWYTKYI